MVYTLGTVLLMENRGKVTLTLIEVQIALFKTLLDQRVVA